ncbi:hypothetical protein [Haliea sp.]
MVTVVGATTVFAQMQESLNQIWDVAPRPFRSGMWVFLEARVLSLFVVTLLFAAMSKILPDVLLPWRDALPAAFITALLFTGGRSLIAMYLANTATHRPTAPEWSFNTVMRYYIALGDAGEITLQADYSWQDDRFLQVENDPCSHQDSYGIANAKVRWASSDARFIQDAFVNNLSDEEYFTDQSTVGDD